MTWPERWPDRTYPVVLALGALLYAATAITNQGIVAVDDYASVMQQFLPAQAHSVSGIAEASDIRSPVPVAGHFAVARVALAMGLTHPIDQLRFNQLVLGLLAFGLMAWAGHTLFAGHQDGERHRLRTIFAFLLGFYCLAPFVFTRPMIESLSAPWVLVAAAAAAVYLRQGGKAWLVAATIAVTVAATMRPQAGVVALALPVVVGLRRQWAELAVLAVAAVVCFVASGLLDFALVGGFHESLREYVSYNLASSSSYGVRPWYNYVLLFLGLSLPPVFLSRYRGLDWRAHYRPLLPVVLMFGLFVVAHSAVPHKEERFAIPALPLFLALLTPLATHILESRRQRWRVMLFAVLNGAALILTVSTPPQRNVLGLAAWLDQRPGIQTVILAQENILLPAAFIRHPIVEERGLEAVDAADAGLNECATVVVTLAGAEGTEQLARSERYREVARFSPGPLEAAVVWQNPRHNARRGPILVFTAQECPASPPTPPAP